MVFPGCNIAHTTKGALYAQAYEAKIKDLENEVEHAELLGGLEVARRERAAAAHKEELSKVQEKAELLPRVLSERNSLR